jgi:glutaredoxin 1/glutaredoxin 3
MTSTVPEAATPRYRIYGYDACTYCRRAKTLLEEEGIPYDYVALEDPAARAAFLDARGFQGMQRTYPRIWTLRPDGTEGRLVGGFSDLELEVVLGVPFESDAP